MRPAPRSRRAAAAPAGDLFAGVPGWSASGAPAGVTVEALPPLSELARASVLAVLQQLRERPTLWGPYHLGVLLKDALPEGVRASPIHQEVRARLGLPAEQLGSLAIWSRERKVEEVVAILERIGSVP